MADALSTPGSGIGTQSGSASISSADGLFTLIAEDIGLTFTTKVLKGDPRWNRGASYADQPILNRSSEVVTFSGGRCPTLDISLQLFGVHEKGDIDKVQRAKRALAALLLPVESGVKGPALCRITLGGDRMIEDWPCVCLNVSQTFEADSGWSDDYKARVVAVTLTFKGLEDDSVDAREESSSYTHQDPEFRKYDASGSGASSVGQIRSAATNIVSALGQLGVSVSPGGVSFNAATFLGTAVGLDPASPLAQLGLTAAGGLPQIGGARIIRR